MDGPARSVVLLGCDPLLDALPEDGSSGFLVERVEWTAEDDEASAPEVVGKIVAGDPLAVCIGSDVPEQLALDVSRRLDAERPEIGVVLLGRPTGELWSEAARVGVRDIVAPDASVIDLQSSITAALERGERLRAAGAPVIDAPRGKVIVVLSPKGGSGKTMVASNVAVALAGTHSGDTVLVDLDCVFGDVASVLGLVPEHTAGQLASIPSFDSTTLKVFLTRHEQSGLYVLAGSGSPEEGETLHDELAGRIIDMLARDFAYVVVDTAAGLDERALAAIDRATDVVFLASMDVASIRNLVKEINALDRLAMASLRRHFILNRADTRVGLEVADVEAAVGMKVDAALASSRLVPLSMNQGKVVVIEQPDSPIAQALVAFSHRFVPQHALERAGRRDHRSRFSMRRR